jgi:hypothetical protein
LPTVSAFYGIVIAMFHDDHPPPHFHARHGEHRARVRISTGQVIEGRLPRPAARLVRHWAAEHRAELQANWRRAQALHPLERIEPLP